MKSWEPRISGAGIEEAIVPVFVKPFDVLDGPANLTATSVISEGREHHVPFGAPPWITPTDISEAIQPG